MTASHVYARVNDAGILQRSPSKGNNNGALVRIDLPTFQTS